MDFVVIGLVAFGGVRAEKVGQKMDGTRSGNSDGYWKKNAKVGSNPNRIPATGAC
jgi:hypothetical protein